MWEIQYTFTIISLIISIISYKKCGFASPISFLKYTKLRRSVFNSFDLKRFHTYSVNEKWTNYPRVDFMMRVMAVSCHFSCLFQHPHGEHGAEKVPDGIWAWMPQVGYQRRSLWDESFWWPNGDGDFNGWEEQLVWPQKTWPLRWKFLMAQ
jgi:hypothetical protein